MRLLLINADDFGLDVDTFDTTRRLMEAGIVRSATILLDQPMSEAAIAYARLNGRSHSFGLHFNIAEGAPMAARRSSLTGSDGVFQSPIKQRLDALFHRLAPSDIAAEAEAQLAFLQDHGVRPSHLDSHGHLHKFPAVLNALIPVLARHKITRVRLPQTLYDNERIHNRIVDAHCLRAFRAHRAIRATDHFFNTRRHDARWFDRFLGKLPRGTTELGVHPGNSEDWRRAEAAPLFELQEGSSLPKDVRLASFHELPA